MLFSSIPFLYYFLPAVLMVYFLVPKNLKNAVLLVFSLVFYAWGEPKYMLLMVISILLFFAYGMAIEKAGTPAAKKGFLILASVTGVVFLGVFKYADFLISSLNGVTGWNLPLPGLKLPIGISFYTFQCMGYAADVYRGRVSAQKSLVNFGTYVSMFPQLIAGPIVRYSDICERLDHRKTSIGDCWEGTQRFLIGLGKKVLLANQFGALTECYRASAQPTVLFAWLCAVGYTLQIYFDFSGYSDMAIGLGRIFGFSFPENFNYPFISRSVSEFWRRWHISLGSWFRDYVYIPLGGNRCSTGRHLRNILVVWMLTGLWHGAAWNFVLWGLLFAVALMIEKWTGFQKKLPELLQHMYVLLLVIFSFVLFQAGSVAEAGRNMAAMLGFGGLPLSSPERLYYLRSYGVLLAAGCLFSTPAAGFAGKRLGDTAVFRVAKPLGRVLLLLICTAYLVDGSFNPFLYFRV